MKKLIFISLFLLIFSLFSSSAFALLVTDNTDEDNFLYQAPYNFATSNLTASVTLGRVSVMSNPFQDNFYYVVPRDARITGISVASDRPITAGGATFDVTINDKLTGVQAWIQPNTITALGNTGSAGTQYGYIRQYRNETAAAIGFRRSGNKGYYHNADNPYGKATPLVAGDRIGVKVTSSSGLLPITCDYIITIYVLQ